MVWYSMTQGDLLFYLHILEFYLIVNARMVLNMGGDDISEFLYVLLQKINFPYRDMDLSRAYDWNVMEDLKARLCTRIAQKMW